MSCSASASTGTPTRCCTAGRRAPSTSPSRELSGTSLPEGAGDFRLLDRKAVDAMNLMRERVRFNKGLFAWMGFRSIGVPFHVEPRQGGASRWRPRQLLRFALDGIASFTTIPLRVWSYLGLHHLASGASATPCSSWSRR